MTGDVIANPRQRRSAPEPTSLEEKFTRRVISSPDCLLWTGANIKGYGHIGHRGQSLKAHRVAWERVYGPIPDGLQVDHLCRVRLCVNPAHMELVTREENLARAVRYYDVPEVCRNGHVYTEQTRYIDPQGRTGCIPCRRDANRRYRTKAGAR